jgi:hypothetical protein
MGILQQQRLKSATQATADQVFFQPISSVKAICENWLKTVNIKLNRS